MRNRRDSLFLTFGRCAGLVTRALAILAIAASAVATNAPMARGAWQEETDIEALARQALELLNQARAEAGLRPLAPSADLARLAGYHSKEQAERGRVSHHSYEFDLSTERRIRISFPHLPRFAENVARNRDVARIHQALMDSPGHRSNRMDPEFTHVGIGVAHAGQYMLYLTEVFVTAPTDAPLVPLAFYFDAAPGAYEAREDPRVEIGDELITVGPPGRDNPEHWTSLGIDAFQQGDLETAERHFRTALDLDPDYDFAAFDLARVLVYRGSYAAAVTILDRLLVSRPGDVEAHATRGNAALLMQDYEAAERSFRTVLEERPRDAGAWYNLGLSLEYRDLLERAEDAYLRALYFDPELLPAQVGLVRVRRR